MGREPAATVVVRSKKKAEISRLKVKYNHSPSEEESVCKSWHEQSLVIPVGDLVEEGEGANCIFVPHGCVAQLKRLHRQEQDRTERECCTQEHSSSARK